MKNIILEGGPLDGEQFNVDNFANIFKVLKSTLDFSPISKRFTPNTYTETDEYTYKEDLKRPGIFVFIE